jgi:hypothetical protein
MEPPGWRLVPAPGPQWLGVDAAQAADKKVAFEAVSSFLLWSEQWILEK